MILSIGGRIVFYVDCANWWLEDFNKANPVLPGYWNNGLLE
jgi:hypothetical protein